MGFKVGDRVRTNVPDKWQDLGIVMAVMRDKTVPYELMRYSVTWDCGNYGVGYLEQDLFPVVSGISAVGDDNQEEANFVNMGYTGSTSIAFKNGDRVRSKINRLIGIVKSHDDIAGVCNVTWEDDWFGTETISENSIELLNAPKPSWEPTCECGSDSVPAYVGHHSQYCPKYKKD